MLSPPVPNLMVILDLKGNSNSVSFQVIVVVGRIMKEPRIKFPILYISKALTFSLIKVNLFFIDSKYDKFSTIMIFYFGLIEYLVLILDLQPLV